MARPYNEPIPPVDDSNTTHGMWVLELRPKNRRLCAGIVVVTAAGRQRALIQIYTRRVNRSLVALAISDWETLLEERAASAWFFETTHQASLEGGVTLFGAQSAQELRIPRTNNEHTREHLADVVREYGEAPPVPADKHKLLQFLVNLMRNAKHAIYERDGQDLRLTLRIAPRGENPPQIGVCNNGGGIAAENLTRIFSHGFTTKNSGHGFGLHTSAIAAKEMGGPLTAHSEGADQGATFVLELPLQPAEATR